MINVYKDIFKHFRNCIIKIKHKNLTLQKSIFFHVVSFLASELSDT